MIVNSANLRTLYTGFSTAFQGGFTGVTPLYTRIAQTVPSSTRSNEYGWLGQIPRIREWIGDRVVQNLATQGYTIRNRTFESTIAVLRDDIDDDNLGIYSGIFQEFGRSSATFPDELVWALLLAGFAILGLALGGTAASAQSMPCAQSRNIILRDAVWRHERPKHPLLGKVYKGAHPIAIEKAGCDRTPLQQLIAPDCGRGHTLGTEGAPPSIPAPPAIIRPPDGPAWLSASAGSQAGHVVQDGPCAGYRYRRLPPAGR